MKSRFTKYRIIKQTKYNGECVFRIQSKTIGLVAYLFSDWEINASNYSSYEEAKNIVETNTYMDNCAYDMIIKNRIVKEEIM
jgi:hypothetical protein